MDPSTRVPPPVVSNPLDAIGMTPIVRLRKIVPPQSAAVFVKLEYFNTTGSYKDRMALAMIEEAEARGDLKPGMTVVEYTGGSTGSSLAFVCAVKGYRFRVVSSDAFAKEKLDTMLAFGADLHTIPSEGGKVTANLIREMMDAAAVLAKEEGTYYTNQIYNTDSVKGYRAIGKELGQQMTGAIDAFCGGVGTAGMLMGVAKEIKILQPNVRIVALEPASTAVISGQAPGAHSVEGIGIGFIPPLLEKDLFDEIRPIAEAEARQTARRLAREEGIFTGTSSGLNVTAALQLAAELGPGKQVVTIAVDSGLKYLAGDLYRA